MITKGLGLHLDNLPVPVEEARFYQAEVQEIEEHFYTVAIGAAQLSLLALYWRLFKSSSNARTAIFVLTGCVAVWIIVRVRSDTPFFLFPFSEDHSVLMNEDSVC